jgi:Holliday junction resolvasome RuvABC ATP-dependent DNA helicase subunit
MDFIGQDHILESLRVILPYVYETREGNSFLFRGASGYGKTELSKWVCDFLVGSHYQTCLGSQFEFDNEVWVHFIDEIHTMKEPEVLYPLIDSGVFTFVFATNYDSILPEALVNRCKSFIFTDYTDDELLRIFNYHSKIRFPPKVMNHLINISGRNPRVLVKTYASNLNMYFISRREELLKSEEEIIDIVDRIHGIKNGLDRTSRDYLLALHNLGGRGSIKLISSVMRLDENTVKYTVEPMLLFRNLIKITNRGRELC